MMDLLRLVDGKEGTSYDPAGMSPERLLVMGKPLGELQNSRLTVEPREKFTLLTFFCAAR